MYVSKLSLHCLYKFFVLHLETEITLANLHEEMKVLNEALAVEQANVQEVRKQIDEFKARISAQNQEISKRIAGKEQREAQVGFFFKIPIYNTS